MRLRVSNLVYFIDVICFKQFTIKPEGTYELHMNNDEPYVFEDENGSHVINENRYNVFTGDERIFMDEYDTCKFKNLLAYRKAIPCNLEGDPVLGHPFENYLSSFYKPRRKKPLKDKVRGMSFYTLVPKTRLPFNEDEVVRLGDFCKNFISKFFDEYYWVVESGKYKEKPNLHIHFLGHFKEGMSKNFKRDLIKAWNKKHAIKYKLDWENDNGVGIHRVPCNTKEIQEDKKIYLCNSEKGSHENFVDLGMRGQSTTSQ
tara:strand:- start:1252 stop:2025 length:774 start_codon:yes stop_codon:yes gene_type:complete